MAKRRETNVFSLSFLDIMSCGFGAVILIFVVIQHGSVATPQESNLQMMAEIKRIEIEVLNETENLVQLKNTVQQRDDEIATTEEAIITIIQQIKALEQQIAAVLENGASNDKSIEELKSDLKQLEQEAASLESSVNEQTGSDARSFVGDGDRQYLSGVHLGGEHILILLDASASMLDKTIVNIVRRRNMSLEKKLESPKWQRALKTVDWVVANIPRSANVQLFGFNETAWPAVAGSEGSWIRTEDRADVEVALEQLRQVEPKGGTSLHQAFELARNLVPQPDSIFLIVDSLPTIGAQPSDARIVSSRDRVRLFGDALNSLPQNVPVTVILFPMEGDPIAAPSYWRLAQITGGAFLSPPEDWP